MAEILVTITLWQLLRITHAGLKTLLQQGIPDRCLGVLRFYIFNSILGISGRWEFGNKGCAQWTLFMLESIQSGKK